MAYALALLAVALVGAGYLLGCRRARSREEVLKATLDERSEKLKLVEHELLRYTSIDPVSGLPTQQPFQEFLEREWRRASRERQFVSVIMAEIDYFRSLTERHGKLEGDDCLRDVSETVKPLIHRPSDLLARYGGAGKFGIVLGATDARGALVLAERIRLTVEALRRPHPASPTSHHVTLSVGVAAAMPARETAWQEIELIAAAERALAQAVEEGRNTVVLNDAEMAR